MRRPTPACKKAPGRQPPHLQQAAQRAQGLLHLRVMHVHSVGFGAARCLFGKQPMPVAANQNPIARAHARKADGRLLFRIQLYQLHPVKAYQRRKAHKRLYYKQIDKGSVRCAYIEIVSSDVHSCPAFSSLLLTFGGSYIRIKNIKNRVEDFNYGYGTVNCFSNSSISTAIRKNYTANDRQW